MGRAEGQVVAVREREGAAEVPLAQRLVRRAQGERQPWAEHGFGLQDAVAQVAQRRVGPDGFGGRAPLPADLEMLRREGLGLVGPLLRRAPRHGLACDDELAGDLGGEGLVGRRREAVDRQRTAMDEEHGQEQDDDGAPLQAAGEAEEAPHARSTLAASM
ncbi:hypothetical protein [Methylobacterium nonmethylotrophicum]|uniref:hypothetical protein n=1 Tax=Methylobacterium nonmethylotrophicum TaxID=1141884 RepID=UPI00315DD94C